MIASLARARPRDWEAAEPSRQKLDALFGLAVRIALLAERSRSSGAASLSKAADGERRKALRKGLRVIAAGGDAEELDRAFAAVPVAADPGSVIESRLVRSGLRGLLAGEHPYTLMRRMSAHLGLEYFDKAGSWILSRARRRRLRPEALVVPGELPDVVRDLALERRALERALRAAGREIAAASLAGCPQESMELAKPLYGPIGGVVMEDDAYFMRSRLSSDEIAQAQAAFLEIARGLEERGELGAADEHELEADPAFVAELTTAIMALDDGLLRAAFRSASGESLAAAMQGMEPRAHERILEALSTKEKKRVLDAIDDSDLLSGRVVLAAGRELAETLIAASARRGGAGRSLQDRLERVRDWA